MRIGVYEGVCGEEGAELGQGGGRGGVGGGGGVFVFVDVGGLLVVKFYRFSNTSR